MIDDCGSGHHTGREETESPADEQEICFSGEKILFYDRGADCGIASSDIPVIGT